MNTFTLVEFYNFKKVRFYTVQDVDSNISETDRFIKKYEDHSELKEFLFDILALIQKIGERGALDIYFNRKENDFQALPNKQRAKAGYQGDQLRLYCLRISDSIVVLFNGGVKNAGTAQESACSIQFYEASAFTKRIHEALKEGFIYTEDDLILDFKGSRDIIL